MSGEENRTTAYEKSPPPIKISLDSRLQFRRSSSRDRVPIAGFRRTRNRSTPSSQPTPKISRDWPVKRRCRKVDRSARHCPTTRPLSGRPTGLASESRVNRPEGNLDDKCVQLMRDWGRTMTLREITSRSLAIPPSRCCLYAREGRTPSCRDACGGSDHGLLKKNSREFLCLRNQRFCGGGLSSGSRPVGGIFRVGWVGLWEIASVKE